MNFLDNHCVCGATASTSAFAIADWNFGQTDVVADMRRCDACGSLFPDRFPDAASLPLAYADYYTVPAKIFGIRAVKRGVLDAMRADYVRRSLPASARSVLDYGCGSGAYLHEIAEQAPHVERHGTDVIIPVDLAEARYAWIPIERVGHNGQHFDWITLSHVLEHLLDPRAVLETLGAALAPGGALWIATPNAHSALFQDLGGRARDADFPRHRQIFSRECLAEILRSSGFDCEWLVPPRVNAILNLASGLGNLKQPPHAHTGRAGSGFGAMSQTAANAVKPPRSRMEADPELLVICRPRAG